METAPIAISISVPYLHLRFRGISSSQTISVPFPRSVEQLKRIAKKSFKVDYEIKSIFTESGVQINNFNEIIPGQVLYVSEIDPSEPYISPVKTPRRKLYRPKPVKNSESLRLLSGTQQGEELGKATVKEINDSPEDTDFNDTGFNVTDPTEPLSIPRENANIKQNLHKEKPQRQLSSAPPIPEAKVQSLEDGIIAESITPPSSPSATETNYDEVDEEQPAEEIYCHHQRSESIISENFDDDDESVESLKQQSSHNSENLDEEQAPKRRRKRHHHQEEDEEPTEEKTSHRRRRRKVPQQSPEEEEVQEEPALEAETSHHKRRRHHKIAAVDGEQINETEEVPVEEKTNHRRKRRRQQPIAEDEQPDQENENAFEEDDKPEHRRRRRRNAKEDENSEVAPLHRRRRVKIAEIVDDEDSTEEVPCKKRRRRHHEDTVIHNLSESQESISSGCQEEKVHRRKRSHAN